MYFFHQRNYWSSIALVILNLKRIIQNASRRFAQLKLKLNCSSVSQNIVFKPPLPSEFRLKSISYIVSKSGLSQFYYANVQASEYTTLFWRAVLGSLFIELNVKENMDKNGKSDNLKQKYLYVYRKNHIHSKTLMQRSGIYVSLD